jgi:divalent metal cation (Fe/Co/Zn/Cd) transporter
VTAPADRHAGHAHAEVRLPLAQPAAQAAAQPEPARARAVVRARRPNQLTIGYNLAEGGIALAAGVAAGSVSLVGFGLDSAVEVSAALILTWRLARERRGGCTQTADRRATRAIAVAFAALAIYVGLDATRDLASQAHPEVSVVGIALAGMSLLVMPLLARAKARLAPILGSRAAAAEATQTRLCAALSGVLLVGLAANALAGWWWADPAAALGIATLAMIEAVQTWRAESLADTCCG